MVEGSSSYINLIYPSYSKKLLESDAKQKHHHKSKSSFIGNADYIKQQQSQKLHQSGSSKKAANVFNYSQRLKHLINEGQNQQYKYSQQALS